jgi:hypothetical protein
MSNGLNEIFFEGFPKEFGYKRVPVQTKEEMYDLIEMYNGKDSLYCTIFRYMWRETDLGLKPIHDTVTIPAIYIDLDEWGRSYDDMVNLHLWCKARSIKHFVLFSGRGYHVFIFLKQGLKNPSNALYSFSNYLEQKLDGIYDNTAKGNIAKLSRIPWSYNLKRGAYCNPLREDQLLDSSYEEHFKLSQKQQFINPTIGHKLLDISKFSEEKVFSKYKLSLDDNQEVVGSVIEAVEKGVLFYDKMPPCIDVMLKEGKLNYEGRSMVIKYFSTYGYSLGQMKEMFRHSLNPETYKHAIDTHIEVMYKNGFKKELSCNKVKTAGMCPGCHRSSPFENGEIILE